MAKPLTEKERKRRKAEQNKLHGQRRLAERRCIPGSGHLVKHRKPARPSVYDKEPMAIGEGAGGDVRRAAAKKLLDDRQRALMKGYWSSDSNPLNWKFAS